MDACEGEELQLIESLQAQSTEELEGLVQKVADLVQLEEVEFDEKVTEIQQQYDAAVQDFNSKLDDIKQKYNYKYVEQIMTMRGVDTTKFAAPAGEGEDGMEEEEEEL